LEVRLAEGRDVDRVVALLEEASAWIRSLDIDQWPARFPRHVVAERLAAHECYLAWVGGEAVGTFSLQPSDAGLWGERPEDALYLHGLAVRRDHAGLGRKLLAWAEGRAAAAGRRYLRLDCMTDNLRLRTYYERAGYRHVGDRRFPGWTASLYEKRVVRLA
jgi:GNAT superfamily N-acetyltransferase